MSLKCFAVLLSQSGAVDVRLARTETGFSALIMPATPAAGDKPDAAQAALLAALAKPILITEASLDALEAAINENVPKMAAVRQSPIDAYAEFVAAQQANAKSATAKPAATGKPGKKVAAATPAASAAGGDEDDEGDAGVTAPSATPEASAAPVVNAGSGSILDADQQRLGF